LRREKGAQEEAQKVMLTEGQEGEHSKGKRRVL